MNNEVIKVKIKQTGEVIEVYKLSNGNYYDYKNMGEHMPSSSSTGKKEFKKVELILKS